ncbi:hypothetical protein CIC12_03635 [Burkholderia sp. SG-MS1]|nr:hypothetical protein [Paraburkholderia sp. SG-MS1]
MGYRTTTNEWVGRLAFRTAQRPTICPAIERARKCILYPALHFRLWFPIPPKEFGKALSLLFEISINFHTC